MNLALGTFKLTLANYRSAGASNLPPTYEFG